VKNLVNLNFFRQITLAKPLKINIQAQTKTVFLIEA
jgi:hypothetical protein